MHICTKDLEQEIKMQIVRNNVKRKALEQISERPSKLLHEEIKKRNVSTSTLRTTDVNYIKNHARPVIYPKLPPNLNEYTRFWIPLRLPQFCMRIIY